MSSTDLLKQLRVAGDPQLDDRDAADTFGWKRDEAEALFADEMIELVELQKRLFAGKDSTIRAVMSGLNHAGVDVQPFGILTEEERGHDYLWRIHAHAPKDGYIAVFNRSHYEDVLVVRVKEFAPEKVWKKRYDHIRNFEQMLSDEGTHIAKIFLNVSKETQKKRFEERL